MRTTIALVLVTMLTTVTIARAQRLTTDDPNYKALSNLGSNIGLYQDKESKAWLVADGKFADIKGASCMKTLDQLAAAGGCRLESNRG